MLFTSNSIHSAIMWIRIVYMKRAAFSSRKTRILACGHVQEKHVGHEKMTLHVIGSSTELVNQALVALASADRFGDLICLRFVLLIGTSVFKIGVVLYFFLHLNEDFASQGAPISEQGESSFLRQF